jgi:hypothetical protein
MSAVYDTMQVITCDVATTRLGQAASVAAALLAAGAPGKRMALPGARVVMQQPPQEEPLRGQPSDVEIHAAELLRLREQLAGTLVRHTGQTPGRIADDLERDKVFDASATREYGLIDHVVASRKLSAAPSAGRRARNAAARTAAAARSHVRRGRVRRPPPRSPRPGRPDQPGPLHPHLRGPARRTGAGRAGGRVKEALTPMHIRGDSEVYTHTPTEALRVPAGERRAKRVTVPPVSRS